MAGLLDIFGTSGQGTLGLLGGDVGSARDDAQAQALYALAGSLLSGGPTGLSIVKGLQQGQQAYRSAMRGQIEDQLSLYQIQEMKRKKDEEEAAKQRKALAQQILMRGYVPGQEAVAEQPAMYYGQETKLPVFDDEGNLMPGAAAPVAGRAAVAPGYDFSKVAPVLMAGGAGQEGIDELLKRINLQKAMSGDLTTLAEGATLVRTNPLTRQVETVATGAPKPAKLTDKEGNAALLLFGTSDVEKLRDIPGAIDAVRREAKSQRMAENPQINLNDPTAVQAQQLKTINQWEGLLNQNKATEVAERANNFYNAFNLAQAGNTNADGAMIYNVAKLYDPGGVVQAGDINSIVGVRSIPSNVQLLAQKISKGGTLLPKERENLKSIIDNIVDVRKKGIEPSLRTYRSINRSLGGSDDAIVNPFDLIEKPKSLNEILGGR